MFLYFFLLFLCTSSYFICMLPSFFYICLFSNIIFFIFSLYFQLFLLCLFLLDFYFLPSFYFLCIFASFFYAYLLSNIIIFIFPLYFPFFLLCSFLLEYYSLLYIFFTASLLSSMLLSSRTSSPFYSILRSFRFTTSSISSLHSKSTKHKERKLLPLIIVLSPLTLQHSITNQLSESTIIDRPVMHVESGTIGQACQFYLLLMLLLLSPPLANKQRVPSVLSSPRCVKPVRMKRIIQLNMI